MLSLFAKIRKEKSNKLGNLRKKGILPAVLYGPEIESQIIEVDLAKFRKIYEEAGESSLINLNVKGSGSEGKDYSVLIHDIQQDPLSEEFIHIDFYQPILTEEVEVTVPIVFEGESLAVKELGGTLVKVIQELEIKALPQNLPHEIKVNVEKLKTFEDEILIKDLEIPEGVAVLKEPEEIVVNVAEPTKVEEELEKPIEEKVEEVEEAEEKEEVEGEKEKKETEEQKKEEKS